MISSLAKNQRYMHLCWHFFSYLVQRFKRDGCRQSAAALTYMSLFAHLGLGVEVGSLWVSPPQNVNFSRRRSFAVLSFKFKNKSVLLRVLFHTKASLSVRRVTTWASAVSEIEA